MTQAQTESWFRRYGKAFDDFDANAIADLLHVPCTILGPGYVVALTDRAEVVENFTVVNAAHRELGYRHAELEECVAIPTGDATLAEARVRWAFHRADGSTIQRFRMIYFLKELDTGWRIAIAINVGEAS